MIGGLPLPPAYPMYKHDTSTLPDFDTAPVSAEAIAVITYSASAASILTPVRGAPRFLGSSHSEGGPFNPLNATVALYFNEPVARGSGVIYITDGVAQTVIDRVSGKPVMHIAGATDTRAISVSDASQVSISNGVVQVKAGDLQPDVQYNVLIDPGAFVDVDGNVFAGIAASSTIAFATSGIDLPPTAAITLDKTVVGNGGTIGVTVTFSEAVQDISAGDFIVHSGSLSGFTPNAARTVWTATFTPSPFAYDATNRIELHGANIVDLNGTTGSGTYLSENYVVDMVAPTITSGASIAHAAAGAALTLTFSEAVQWNDASTISLHDGDATRTIASSDVTFSSDHKTMTISGAALGLAADKSYSLTLPASIVDQAANQLANRALTVDTYTGPRIGSMVLDTVALYNGDTATLKVVFSKAVPSLGASAFLVPSGTLSGFATTDGGITWTAVLTPSAGIDVDVNQITLNAASVTDSAGNAGSGIMQSLPYSVDTIISAFVNDTITIVDNGADPADGVTGLLVQTIRGTYSGTLDGSEKVWLFVNGSMIPQSDVTIDPVARQWSWTGTVTAGENDVVVFIANGVGNQSSFAYLTFDVDVAGPRLEDGYEYGGIDPADALILEFDEDIYWSDGSKLRISDGTTTREIGRDQVTISNDVLMISAAQHGLATDGSYTLTLPTGLKDEFGNAASTSTVYIDTIPDSTRPEALAAYVSSLNGVKKIGDTIDIIVRFSENVKVDSYASLLLNDGLMAEYHHHVGRDVTFRYVVEEGDQFDNLELTSTEGLIYTVRDIADNYLDSADIKFNVLVRHDGSSIDIDVDGVRPAELDAPNLVNDNGPSSTDNVTGHKALVFNGSGANPYALFHLYKNGTYLAMNNAAADGSWTITTPELGSGTYDFSVVQFDSAGNVSWESDGLEVTIDADGPVKVSNTVHYSVLTLSFNEKIAFTSGEIYVYDGATLVHTIRHSDEASWAIIGAEGRALELQPYGLENGEYTVKFSADALQDEYGNFMTELVGAAPGVEWAVYYV